VRRIFRLEHARETKPPTERVRVPRVGSDTNYREMAARETHCMKDEGTTYALPAEGLRDEETPQPTHR
jgi:hypothetical protein